MKDMLYWEYLLLINLLIFCTKNFFYHLFESDKLEMMSL